MGGGLSDLTKFTQLVANAWASLWRPVYGYHTATARGFGQPTSHPHPVSSILFLYLMAKRASRGRGCAQKCIFSIPSTGELRWSYLVSSVLSSQWLHQLWAGGHIPTRPGYCRRPRCILLTSPRDSKKTPRFYEKSSYSKGSLSFLVHPTDDRVIARPFHLTFLK